MTLTIGISGLCGRMGQTVYACALAEAGVEVVCGIDRALQQLPAQRPAQVCASAAQLMAEPQVFIDFSRPEGALEVLAWAREHRAAVVMGTTGFDAGQRRRLEEAAQHVALVYAANFSVGVNVLLGLIGKAAAVMAAADVEIIEAHHRHKADAPSGTALAMGEAAARGRGRELSEVMVTQRACAPGPREDGSIGFAVVRGGEVVGDHRLLLCADGEQVELAHRAHSRTAFAAGALRAARWVAGRPPGLYSMQQVLDLA